VGVSGWIRQSFADGITRPMSLGQVIRHEDLLMHQCPCKKSALGFSIGLPNGHDSEFAE
jgi:hypothetical protein